MNLELREYVTTNDTNFETTFAKFKAFVLFPENKLWIGLKTSEEESVDLETPRNF